MKVEILGEERKEIKVLAEKMLLKAQDKRIKNQDLIQEIQVE